MAEDAKPSTSTPASSTEAQEAALKAIMVQLTTDGIPKLHCPVCDRALASLSGYVRHLKKHDPPGGFLCRYCDARFCHDDHLKHHLDEVHTTIACRICKSDATFSNETDYREHIRVVHNGIDRHLYVCDKCGIEYKTEEPYKRHMDTKCGIEKPFKCTKCDISFVTKYNLKQHNESHTGERNFCCSYCGKNFLQKGRLVEHERSHTGEKPYKCDVCGKCFAHRESIVTHSSIHTGIRLVECRRCKTRFSCHSNLIKHRRARPTTCGLPEFNPPNNHLRKRRTRIPATLNPTTEINIRSINKIIKPNDKEKDKQKMRKPYERPKRTARKRTGAGPSADSPASSVRGPKRGSKPKNESDTEDEDVDVDGSNLEQINEEIELNSDDEPLLKPLKYGSSPNHEPTVVTSWSDSDEDYPDFDPPDSESDAEKYDFKLPVPVKQEVDDFYADDTASSFEYNIAIEYVQPEYDVKEEHGNIFNEKDNLLDVLLHADERAGTLSKSFESVKMEHESIELGETEVMLFKEENTLEEDVLAVEESGNDKEFTNCKILLQDITQRYPKLKNEISVKVPRNAKASSVPQPKKSSSRSKRSKASVSEVRDKPVRKYRKRGEPRPKSPNGPKRMAKITQKQLRAKLKMIKKEEKSWRCPHCIKIYHMRKPYESHLRNDHQLTEDVIKQQFIDEDMGDINDIVFKCPICGKIYLMEKRLLAHIKLHGPDGKLTFKCPCYCNIYFPSKDEATAHAQKEHRELLYCELCDKFMNGHDGLKNHMKHHHREKPVATAERNGKRNLVCDKCGKKFSGRTSLSDHVRSDCGLLPLYACHVCGKHLTTAGILKTHLLLHKDDTPFQCDKCGKAFKVKAQYKTHIRTRHTDYKPFKCHLCPKEYPYRESLLTHMTVHTGIKRFLCNGCGKRFTCISNLQAHRKVHADTCGTLPLNARATQYMGVQKGNLLLGAKPEAGIDYQDTNTLIAKEVLDRDIPMAQELNFPSVPAAPLVTVPLNYASATAPIPMSNFMLPPPMISHMITDSPHSSSSSSYN